MDCPTEEALIRKALADVPGVVALRFDLLARELTVLHTLSDLGPVTRAIAGLGMSRPCSRSLKGVGRTSSMSSVGTRVTWSRTVVKSTWSRPSRSR